MKEATFQGLHTASEKSAGLKDHKCVVANPDIPIRIIKKAKPKKTYKYTSGTK